MVRRCERCHHRYRFDAERGAICNDCWRPDVLKLDVGALVHREVS